MSQLQVKDLKNLTLQDVGRTLSDGQSVQGQIRGTKKGLSNSSGLPALSVDFRLIYRFAAKQHKLYLGSWPKSSLTEIRAQRDFYKGMLANGIDPIAEITRQQEIRSLDHEIEHLRQSAERQEQQELANNRLLEIQQRRERQTYRQFFEQDFFPNTLKIGRADGGDEVIRSFEKDVFPVIGDIALEDVCKEHLKLILDTIGQRATKSQNMVRTKKKVLSDVRQSLSYAFENDLIPGDPSQKISKKSLGKDKMGDRVLSEHEIADLMQKLPNCDLSLSYQLALLITLATGVRVADELLTARWTQVDFNARIFYVQDPKNGVNHQIHLSDYVWEKFQALHTISGRTEWIFPSQRNLDKHINIKDLAKKVADRQRGAEPALQGRTQAHKNSLELSLGKWRPHDLRRTMSTTMVELDITPDIADKCLNHLESDSNRRTYILAKNKKAMKTAWDLIGSHLQSIESRINAKKFQQ